MTIDLTRDALELSDPDKPWFVRNRICFHADPAISYNHVQRIRLSLFFFFFFINCIMWKDDQSYFTDLVVSTEICITCLRHIIQEAPNNPFLL